MNHNANWVECLIDGEEQPVIIGKHALPAECDAENGKWTEKGDSLKVLLIEHHNYVLQGDIFTEKNITKIRLQRNVLLETELVRVF